MLPQIAETHTGMVFLVGSPGLQGEEAGRHRLPRLLHLEQPRAGLRPRGGAQPPAGARQLSRTSPISTPPGAAPLNRSSSCVATPTSCRLATMVRRGEPVEDAPDGGRAAILAVSTPRPHRGPRGRRRGPGRRDHRTLAGEPRRAHALRRWRGARPGSARSSPKSAGWQSVSSPGAPCCSPAASRERKIVDGHADLLADDIFCLPDGPALLDCLEFDDRLRYVDVIDDAAFLAMDLEFLGRPDLADALPAQLHPAGRGRRAGRRCAHFYIAYRAVVRAKVDCVRHTQGHAECGRRRAASPRHRRATTCAPARSG